MPFGVARAPFLVRPLPCARLSGSSKRSRELRGVRDRARGGSQQKVAVGDVIEIDKSDRRARRRRSRFPACSLVDGDDVTADAKALDKAR